MSFKWEKFLKLSLLPRVYNKFTAIQRQWKSKMGKSISPQGADYLEWCFCDWNIYILPIKEAICLVLYE
jgi:hypothetical protein